MQQNPKQAPILGKYETYIFADNPSVSLRLTAPFTQGSQECAFLYIAFSFFLAGTFCQLATPQSRLTPCQLP